MSPPLNLWFGVVCDIRDEAEETGDNLKKTLEQGRLDPSLRCEEVQYREGGGGRVFMEKVYRSSK